MARRNRLQFDPTSDLSAEEMKEIHPATARLTEPQAASPSKPASVPAIHKDVPTDSLRIPDGNPQPSPPPRPPVQGSRLRPSSEGPGVRPVDSQKDSPRPSASPPRIPTEARPASSRPKDTSTLRPGRVPHLFRLTDVVDRRLRAVAETYGLDLLGTISMAVTEMYKGAVLGGLLKPE